MTTKNSATEENDEQPSLAGINPAATDSCQAVVKELIYYKEDTGYTVFRAKIGYDIHTVVCKCVPFQLTDGTEIEMKYQSVRHPKFGPQLMATQLSEVEPTTVAGIQAYLSTGRVSGVGPAIAQRIVEQFKDDTFNILDNDPGQLLRVKGIGNKAYERILASWKKNRETAYMIMQLRKFGISDAYANKVYKKYGEHSVGIVRKNPYKLAEEISGIGFKIADQIARSIGFSPEHPYRLRSGIFYTLKEAQKQGHCYLPSNILTENALSNLAIGRALIEDTIEALCAEKTLMAVSWADSTEVDGPVCYYLTKIYQMERYVERRLRQLTQVPHPHVPFTDRGLLTEEQCNAVEMALSKGLAIITGAAGSGKTTTLKFIIRSLEQHNLTYCLASPTGKASKRIQEATGRNATTIHRLIGYGPNGIRKNEDDTIDSDYVILDEASMISLDILEDLLRAIPTYGRLLLIGDHHQLPSIGIGKCFTDLIHSGICPIVTLKTIHRQDSDSSIIRVANDIKNGTYPKIPNSGDVYFFKIEEPELIAQKMVELATQKIPAKFGIQPSDIQVIVPMRRGPIGTQNLNKMIQDILIERDVPALRDIKLGSRVMQLSNNYESMVFNGDQGTVAHIDKETNELYVDFEGVGQVIYGMHDLDQLTLAYAITCHKAQGSEASAIIFPVSTVNHILNSRPLFYTAASRAKKLLIFVGTSRALAMGIKNFQEQNRNTGMFKTQGKKILN